MRRAVLLALHDDASAVGRGREDVGAEVTGAADDFDLAAAISFAQRCDGRLETVGIEGREVGGRIG